LASNEVSEAFGVVLELLAFAGDFFAMALTAFLAGAFFTGAFLTFLLDVAIRNVLEVLS
jgi:hypothetical protein